MDVFNSALRNPLPPIRNEADKRKEDDPQPRPQLVGPEDSDSEGRKKKNSRRKHRNSHLGCGTCKKRRIKCDENLPQCFNCVKGKLHCAYLNLDAPARNALRMAQYNQNLRQDRNDDPHQGGKEQPKELLIAKDRVPPPPHYAGFVPYLMHPQHNGAQTMQHLPPPLQNAPNAPPGTTATLIQSPYGPLVLFQPMAAAVSGIPTYSPMQVQVMAPQLPVLYQQDVQMQMMQLVHMGGPLEQPVMMVQGNMNRNSFDGSSGPVMVPAGQMPMNGQMGPSPLLVNGPIASGSVPPAAMASSKDVNLPPLGNLSDPASMRTSPRLTVRPATSTLLSAFDHEPRVKPDDASVRLPPINAIEKPQSANTSPVLNGNDKVASIQRLLS